MLQRLTFVAIPALVLLGGCDDLMAPMASGDVRTSGAIGAETTATTPEGIVAAQLAAPTNAGDCTRLALIIEDAEAGAAAHQAALDQRAQLGCPPLAVTN